MDLPLNELAFASYELSSRLSRQPYRTCSDGMSPAMMAPMILGRFFDELECGSRCQWSDITSVAGLHSTRMAPSIWYLSGVMPLVGVPGTI